MELMRHCEMTCQLFSWGHHVLAMTSYLQYFILLFTERQLQLAIPAAPLITDQLQAFVRIHYCSFASDKSDGQCSSDHHKTKLF